MAFRFSFRLFFSALFSFVLVIACGRAGLDDYMVDAGKACSAETCPEGCCDAAGQCRVGSDARACGNFGSRCLDCVAGGGLCSKERKECGTALTSCDATSCPNGCCTKADDTTFFCLAGVGDANCGKGGQACENCGPGRMCSAATHACIAGGCGPESCDGCCVGNQCLKGLDGATCGSKGQACANCAAQGQACTANSGAPGGRCEGTPSCGPANCKGCCSPDGKCVGGIDQTACGLGGVACKGCTNAETCNVGTGKCEPAAKCGPNNCPGDSCCFNDECVPGTGATACGSAGATCQNCAGQGLTCNAGKCVQPACTQATCPNGCCQGNVCVTGAQNDACGRNGAVCTDCTVNGRVCGANNTCQIPCDAQTCGNGCCEGNICRGGFVDTRCGLGGGACQDCTAQGKTCDPNQRSCIAPNQCPTAYAGCAAGVTTPVAVPSQTCSVQNLQDAAVACAQGANSGPCVNFFAFLAQNSPDCGTCLGQFRFPFNDGTGIAACASPFVDATCNHNTGCVTDCVDTSCAQCGGGGATNQCRATVRNNQCGALIGQATACVGAALQGPGAFCNPAGYPAQGRFGHWLEGVGTTYCGP